MSCEPNILFIMADDMQGCSFRPLLVGEKPEDWRTSMYYRCWMHLAHHWVPAGQPLGMKGAIPKPTEPEWELFDLEKDPNEMKNVYEDLAYADIVEELTYELEQLRKKLKER